jgi:tripartite-type tricarboxylate transporter receptor subunit TctC
MRALLCAVAALFAMAGLTFAQGNYPEQTVRILVGFPPGTAPDVAARAISDKMAAGLGKPVVVENVSGAAGNAGIKPIE